MLDVHPPRHPVHAWRDFFIHIATNLSSFVPHFFRSATMLILPNTMFRPARVRKDLSMFTRTVAVLAAVLCTAAAFAQTDLADNTVRLDVTVKSNGAPPALQQGDFTVLDNKKPQTISSFRGVGEKQDPVEVVLVVDEVNAPYTAISSVFLQLGNFLRANGGQLQYPTTIGVLTAAGVHLQEGFSKDGNALAKALEDTGLTLHSIQRGDDINAVLERFQISVKGLRSSASRVADEPGRKIVIWISPGWPLMETVQLEQKNRQGFYDAILTMNAELQKARVTVYCIDPYGASTNIGQTYAYEGHLKAVTKLDQVEPANLALPVFALHSGGELIGGSNDIGGSILKILGALNAHYEITYSPPASAHPDEYHHIDVKIAKSGLTARTIDGYYAPHP
jgi:VWFA-related protein